MDPKDRKLVRRAKSRLRAQTEQQQLTNAMIRMQRRVDAVRQQRDPFVETDREPAHDVAWKAFRKTERTRQTPEKDRLSLDLQGVQQGGQAQEKEVFHTKLSARLKWTKNFEARIKAQQERCMSQLSQQESDVERRVAKLASGNLNLGQDMRLTGKFAGHESEAAAALRHGARDAFDEPGFKQRKSITRKRDLRLGRVSAEPGDGSSMSNTEKILALQGRTSAPPVVRRREARAAERGESVPSQLPRGVLPETVLLRRMVDRDQTGHSIARESFAGKQSEYVNPRYYVPIDSVSSSPPSNMGAATDSQPLNLTQNIRALELESERIESKLGVRTRCLAPCRVTAPSRVI